MTQLYLCSDIHVCLDNGCFVFLDLGRNKYRGCDRERSRILATVLHGWPRGNQTGPARKIDKTTTSYDFEDFVKGGVLTPDPISGKIAEPPNVVTPVDTLLTHEDSSASPAGLSDALNFFIAGSWADLALRRKPIDQIVHKIQDRKQRRADQLSCFDYEKAQEKVRTFNTLRALYPRKYLCLFDSLALIEFLARFEIFPTWVFGVKAGPFRAHCWVQEGTTTFNESVDQAESYTPIMAV
ncbi:MAG: lasso peptide biosynthesis B2 protein [Kiloniellales bacterium]|nr:lasso peptide biosynthesis B2 protein [Kiloniellales bacterium]